MQAFEKPLRSGKAFLAQCSGHRARPILESYLVSDYEQVAATSSSALVTFVRMADDPSWCQSEDPTVIYIVPSSNHALLE
jgi:hypothetical protein